MFNDNNGELDILGVIGILLGYSNLVENRQQSAHNDIERHNHTQEKRILADLHEQFERQNELLYYQNTLLHEILDKLKEKD